MGTGAFLLEEYCKQKLLLFGATRPKHVKRCLSRASRFIAYRDVGIAGQSDRLVVANAALREESGIATSSNQNTSDGSVKKGFHQQRFTATERPQHLQQAELAVQIR